jgi:hypothetical protein
MSTTLNRPRFQAWFGLLGLAALALSGCSDHGPVGIFSPELFHKNVNGPLLAYYSANQISFTVQADSACSNCVTIYTASPPNGTIPVPNLAVVIVNNGGSGTYGPVQNVFSVQTDAQTAPGQGFTNPGTDPIVVQLEGNNGGSGAWVTPQDGNDPSSCDCGTAISNLGAGSEIAAFAQTQVTLYQGYFNGNNANSGYVDDTQSYSLAFTVNPGTVGTGAWNGQLYSVPIYMSIRDGIGDSYASSFTLYITTD